MLDAVNKPMRKLGEFVVEFVLEFVANFVIEVALEIFVRLALAGVGVLLLISVVTLVS